MLRYLDNSEICERTFLQETVDALILLLVKLNAGKPVKPNAS